MNDPINPAVLAAAQATEAQGPNPLTLQELRDKVARLRDEEAAAAELDERLKRTNERIYALKMKELPDLMAQAGVPRLELEAQGNHPAVEIKAENYYKANISSDWPDDKRQAAFDWLSANGHEDIIKVQVTASFSKGDFAKAQSLASALAGQGYNVSMKQEVPWATLTSWLKEQVEKFKTTPPLETLGATIGRIAKLKVKD